MRKRSFFIQSFTQTLDSGLAGDTNSFFSVVLNFRLGQNHHLSPFHYAAFQTQTRINT